MEKVPSNVTVTPEGNTAQHFRETSMTKIGYLIDRSAGVAAT